MSDNEPTDEVEQPADGRLVERDEGDGLWYEPPEAKRRNVVKWIGGLAGGISLAGIAAGPIFGLSDAGLGSVGRGSKIYSKGVHLVDKQGKRLGVDTLESGSSPEKHKLVLPELKKGKPLKTKEATTLLLRYAENEFEKPTNTDGTAKGYVAYSMVCTHAGCLVEGHADGVLRCPCHGSEYDGKAGAKVVAGPAPRSIPQLPIAVSDSGKLLVATGTFEGPIGPQ